MQVVKISNAKHLFCGLYFGQKVFLGSITKVLVENKY